MVRILGLVMMVAAMVCVVFTSGNVCAQAKNPFEKAVEDRFNAMDANKDGKITYDEYSAGYQKSIKSSFERRDRNGDGALTKDEFMPNRGRQGGHWSGNSSRQPSQKNQSSQQEEKGTVQEKSSQEGN